MGREIIGVKLLESIKELSDLELIDEQLCLGIFLKKADNLISEKMQKIEVELDSKMDLYSSRTSENENKKREIIERYKTEFNRVLEKYEDRFINIQLELQGIQSNQKIALANWRKVLDEKDNLLASNVYQEYIERKQSLEYKMENAMKSDEYYECDRLLKELKDPIEKVESKADACIEKFNNYNELINECLIEANICEKEALESLEKVIKYNFNDKLAKNSPFTKITRFFNKIIFKFSGPSKFKKEVISKMEFDLSNIQNENTEIVKVIEEKNCNFVATILIMREKINEQFKVAIS